MTASIFDIRVLIGDTDTSDELLTDTQINMLIALYTNTFSAAAAAARAIAAKFAREVDATVDSTQASNSQKYEHYKDLADRLDSQARTSGLLAGIPYAGGISIADKETRVSNTDRVTPAFTRTLFDGAD